MGRHNRDGHGVDQHGCEYEISYSPDWLSHVKVTRSLESGRQSTMTLFRNPEPPARRPGKQIRTRIQSEALGIDVEVVLRDARLAAQRVTVDVRAAADAPGPPGEVGLTLHAHERRKNGR